MSSQSQEIRLETVPCPLCGSDQFQVEVTTADLHAGVQGTFTVVRCRSCQHLFMNPRPVEEDLLACYPESYGPHQTVPQTSNTSQPEAGALLDGGAQPRPASGASAKPWYLGYLPLARVPGLKSFYLWLMEDHSQPVPPVHGTSRGLELGCATGLYLQKLKDAGWTVTGVEPVPAASEKARSVGFDVITGTLETVHLDHSSFDLAAAWMVLEHVPDPRRTLLRMRSVLTPGGVLLLSIPNAGCWEARVFGRWWFGWEPPRHLQHFTPTTIRRLLQETGFTEVEVIHQANLSYVLGSLGLWLRSKLPGSRLANRLLSFPAHPTMFGKLLLALPAKFFSLIRQSGRLTVIARVNRIQ